MSTSDPTAIPLSRLLWTGGVVIGASLPHWTRLPVFIPLFLVFCIAWRVAARNEWLPMPPRWLKLILAIAAFLGILGVYQTINGLDAGSALLVVMVALKFFECHTQRDQLVLTIISYFLVFASLLYDGSIVMGLYLFGFVWVTTIGLLQLGRRGRLLPGLPTIKYAGRLLLQSMPIMVVLFLLFPRLPGPLWGLPGDTSSATSGLSDEMSPGDITDLGLSDDIAFRVDFYSAPPSPDRLYWRGPVLSNFNGRTWTRSRGMRRQPAESLDFSGTPTDYFVELEPGNRPWLFALDMPASWSTNSRRRTISMGSDYQLRMFGAELVTGGLSYTVTSHTDYAAREALTEAQRDTFTQLPPDFNPRTRALAAELSAGSPDHATTVERAMQFLREREFFYTLTPPALGRHTADEFLFETREGFCEHYASAFAILLRSAGVPARIVTGYQGGELSALGQYYIVRQSDAHAWTEVWYEDRGWVRVDPVSVVAPERIALGFGGAGGQRTAATEAGRLVFARRMLQAIGSIGALWDRWVEGYSAQLQRGLLSRLGFGRLNRGELFTTAIIATVVLMAALSFYLTVRFRRDRQPDAPAQYFERFSRRLARHRVEPMRTGETPTQYSRRAREALPASAPAIDEIVSTYLAARYEPDDDGTTTARLKGLVAVFSPRSAPASH